MKYHQFNEFKQCVFLSIVIIISFGVDAKSQVSSIPTIEKIILMQSSHLEEERAEGWHALARMYSQQDAVPIDDELMFLRGLNDKSPRVYSLVLLALNNRFRLDRPEYETKILDALGTTLLERKGRFSSQAAFMIARLFGASDRIYKLVKQVKDITVTPGLIELIVAHKYFHNDKEIKEVIIESFESDDTEIRFQAVRNLSRLEIDPRVLPTTISNLLARENDPRVRFEIIKVIPDLSYIDIQEEAALVREISASNLPMEMERYYLDVVRSLVDASEPEFDEETQ